jgi:hypothetical protein
MDTLITEQVKRLQQRASTGNGIVTSFRLVKGPARVTTADPVDAEALSQEFPLVAKFPVSVVPPQLAVTSNKSSHAKRRLYQQDIPKPADDSDEEEAAANPKKKRWNRQRKLTVADRQWILQDDVDFLETMVARREQAKRAKVGGGEPNEAAPQLSSRYEGVVEYNPSRYALLRVINTPSNHDDDNDVTGPRIAISLLPTPYGTITFAQPSARLALSLSQAEQVLEDQRLGITTKQNRAAVLGTVRPPTVLAPEYLAGNNPLLSARIKQQQQQNSKGRLLSKLMKKNKNDDDDDDDDIMGDLAYRKKRSSGAARRELLTDLGDGVAVSNEGVLGGTDNSMFGGRQRFGEIHTEKTAVDDDGGAAAATTERGADGAAMADDFYQRDVGAEYEELDYDANEQFDDDDVDLGEGEVVGDNAGFEDEEEEDGEQESEEEDDEVVGGVAGLASMAGFKSMLAKARGEVPPEEGDDAQKKLEEQRKASLASASSSSQPESMDHISKIMAAAEKTAQAAKAKAQGTNAAATGMVPAADRRLDATNGPDDSGPLPLTNVAPAAAVVAVDDHGLRIVSLDSVRREIWLHHGSIPMKRLMKIFSVSKKATAERQEQFRNVVKELCIVQTDPIAGRTLVLKQHYSNL